MSDMCYLKTFRDSYIHQYTVVLYLVGFQSNLTILWAHSTFSQV